MAGANVERHRVARSRSRSRRRRRSGPRILLWLLLCVLAAMLIAFFVLTDSRALAEPRANPTAEEVGAGHDAVYQLRNSQKGVGGDSMIRWERAHLDGLSALASQGFRPDRLDLEIFQGSFYITASHALPLGRWLNVHVAAIPKGAGFPEATVRIGSLPLSPYFARKLFEAGRWLMQRRGTQVAPLDQLVHDVAIGPDSLSAQVRMPPGGSLIDQLANVGGDVDPGLVLTRYCDIARAQIADPEPDFAAQLRRAFPADRIAEATPASNRAAFIALAMVVVDKRAGYLGKMDEAAAAKCAPPKSAFSLHGRSDLPKHWSLSAALAAGTGTQLAQAMGEWKELADSLNKGDRFARGHPSGFSFVDLAADRSGFRIANASTSEAEARSVAARLSRVTAAELLPPSLLNETEGLHGADFESAYGGIGDPRYAKAVKAIDAVLDREGLLSR